MSTTRAMNCLRGFPDIPGLLVPPRDSANERYFLDYLEKCFEEEDEDKDGDDPYMGEDYELTDEVVARCVGVLRDEQKRHENGSPIWKALGLAIERVESEA